MAQWETLWSFKTGRFKVTCDATPDEHPDLSWCDEDELQDIHDGVVQCLMFRVVVWLDGYAMGSDYLGGSLYRDPNDFVSDHWRSDALGRNTLAMKAAGVCIGHYFPGMVRTAIEEARQEVRRLVDEAPYVRAA